MQLATQYKNVAQPWVGGCGRVWVGVGGCGGGCGWVGVHVLVHICK